MIDVFKCYNFERFFVGPSNSDAFDSCIRFASFPDGASQPFTVFSPHPGNGATHLTAAIYGHVRAHYSNAKTVMMPAESMLRLETFDRIRSFDAVFLDGVGVFVDIDEVKMERIMMALNSLIELNKIVVLNGYDPSALPSNFMAFVERGEVSTINPPCDSVRREVLRQSLGGHHLDADLLESCMEFETKSVRAIIGIVNRMRAIQSIRDGS